MYRNDRGPYPIPLAWSCKTPWGLKDRGLHDCLCSMCARHLTTPDPHDEMLYDQPLHSGAGTHRA